MSNISALLCKDPNTYSTLRRMYPHALEAFKTLPLTEHEITSEATPSTQNLKLDEQLISSLDVFNYSRMILTATRILEILESEDGKDKVDEGLRCLATYDPVQIFVEKLPELYDPSDLPSYSLMMLAKMDPTFLLTYLTARGWGINSSDPRVRLGALNLLALILKETKNQILKAQEKGKIDEIKEIFKVLQIIQKIIKPKYHDPDFKVTENVKIIDFIASSQYDEAINICSEAQRKD